MSNVLVSRREHVSTADEEFLPGLVSKRGEPTTEFTILNEDFPALPGTIIKSGQWWDYLPTIIDQGRQITEKT